MLKLEDQVVSLELAKKLKELGIKQESLFYWEYLNDECYSVKFSPYCVVPSVVSNFKLYSAFTIAELGEMLPDLFRANAEWYLYTENKLNNTWGSSYSTVHSDLYFPLIDDKNNANARAKMVIYLIENGLIKDEVIE